MVRLRIRTSCMAGIKCCTIAGIAWGKRISKLPTSCWEIGASDDLLQWQRDLLGEANLNERCVAMGNCDSFKHDQFPRDLKITRNSPNSNQEPLSMHSSILGLVLDHRGVLHFLLSRPTYLGRRTRCRKQFQSHCWKFSVWCSTSFLFGPVWLLPTWPTTELDVLV